MADKPGNVFDQFDAPKLTDAQIAERMAKEARKFKATGPSRQGNYDYTPGWDAKADPEGSTTHMFKPTDAPVGTPAEKVGDAGRLLANTLTFGNADRLVAGGETVFGNDFYSENLARQVQESENAKARLGWPLATAAEVTGGVTGGSGLARRGLSYLGRLAPTASIAQKVLAGAAEGGVHGALQAAGHTYTGDVKDYVEAAKQGGTAGAVTGGAIPALTGVAQRVITPFPNDPAREALVQGLRQEGVTNISAGQRTDSTILRFLEDIGAKKILGGNPTKDQMQQVTRAQMRRAGLPADATHATAEVVDAGFERIGSNIGRIQGQYPIQFDDQMIQRLGNVQQGSDILSEAEAKTINAFTNRILRPGATLDADALSALRTDLRLALTKGEGEKPLYNRALLSFRDTLDDALERTIQKSGNPADMAALREARRQYANLHLLTDALARSGGTGVSGVVTKDALMASLKSDFGKVAFMRGAGDANDLARGSSAILKNPQDSGTQTRANLDLTKPGTWTGPVYGGAINNRMAQNYWGNQVAPVPVPPGLLQAGGAGAATQTDKTAGPIDRLWTGLLGLGR